MLEFGNKKSSNTGGHSGDGIFIDVGVITRVKPYYNSAPNPAMNNRDIGLEVFYKPAGKELSFEPSVFIGGNFKKDDLNRIVGMGGAFKIDRLFERAGVTFTLNEDGTIPEDALRDLIGRTITVIHYRNDRSTAEKLKTTAWDIVGRENEADDLKEYFLQQVGGGWVRRYLADPAQPETPQVGFQSTEGSLPF